MLCVKYDNNTNEPCPRCHVEDMGVSDGGLTRIQRSKCSHLKKTNVTEVESGHCGDTES